MAFSHSFFFAYARAEMTNHQETGTQTLLDHCRPAHIAFTVVHIHTEKKATLRCVQYMAQDGETCHSTAADEICHILELFLSH